MLPLKSLLISVFGVALACTVVYGTPTHAHFRHHGMLQEALRERLGLNPTSQDDLNNNNNNKVDGEGSIQMQVLAPAEGILTRMMSNVQSTMQNVHEHHQHHQQRLLASPFRLGGGGDIFGKGQEEGENDMHAYRRIVMAVLNHMMQNLQTVEGGQEAARWITALRGSSTKSTSKPMTRFTTTTTPSPEDEPTQMIILRTTASTSTTTTPSPRDDEENKVKFNL